MRARPSSSTIFSPSFRANSCKLFAGISSQRIRFLPKEEKSELKSLTSDPLRMINKCRGDVGIKFLTTSSTRMDFPMPSSPCMRADLREPVSPSPVVRNDNSFFLPIILVILHYQFVNVSGRYPRMNQGVVGGFLH